MVLFLPQPGPRNRASQPAIINTATILFLDDVAGSLGSGKFADLIVIDRDLLTSPEDQISGTHVLRTYLAGKLVYQKQ